MGINTKSKVSEAHVKSLPTYEGGELAAAGVFAGGCQFPLMNLVGRCTDQVFANMPNYLGRIHPGKTQPAITGQTFTYTPPAEGDKCASGTIATDISGCEWFVPEQVEVDYAHEPISWKEAWRTFCSARGLATSCPPPFNRNGSVDMGSTLAEPFVKYLLAGHGQGYLQAIVDGALVGDSANPLQPDGFYTQLEAGWNYKDGAGACDVWNVANQIDWAAITAASVDCDGLPNAGTSGATIDPGTVITMWGEDFDVGGLSLGELMAHFMDANDDYVDSLGGNAQYEIHHPKNWRNCLVAAVSCMRVCCNAEQDVSETNDRYARLRRQSIIDLYPYRDDQIAMLQTPQLDNCIWLGVREVGGCATYGNVWEPTAEIFEQLGSIYGDSFQPGLPATEDAMPVIANTASVLADNFEALAFGTTVDKVGNKCVEAATTSCFTPLAYHRCLWLKICNIDCKTMAKPLNAGAGNTAKKEVAVKA